MSAISNHEFLARRIQDFAPGTHIPAHDAPDGEWENLIDRLLDEADDEDDDRLDLIDEIRYFLEDRSG